MNHEQQISRDALPVVYSNGMVLWIPPVIYDTKCARNTGSGDWDWECSLKFGSWVLNGWQMSLEAYNDQMSVVLHDFNPDLYGWEVQTPEGEGPVDKYYACCPEPYPAIVYTFRLKKIPGGVADSGAGAASRVGWLITLTLVATAWFTKRRV